MKLSAIEMLLAATLLFASGCGASRPKWLYPGSPKQQQRQAQRYDPYPDPELGHHDGSARPRGFENPPPEVTKGRRTRWSWPGVTF